ncbi:MAG TPA: ABC transporter permease [bacterium]|nr:ABC transporter permease [bacterium]
MIPTRYIARRLLQLFPVLFIVGTVVFFTFRIVPGDPAQLALGVDATPEALAALRHEWGLDRPLLTQYLIWMGGVLRGDLGISRLEGHRRVVDILKPKIPATLELVVAGVAFALTLAVPLGIAAAVRAGSRVDQLARVIAMLGFSTPSYWLAILLMLLFSLRLRWLPAGGYVSFGNDAAQHLRFLVLPVVTIGFIQAASLVRFLRSGMLEVLNLDYIRTARAKGLSENGVIYRHALKNSLISLITVLGTNVGALIGGLVVTEQIFAWPGLGWQMVTSISFRDYQVVQGAVLYIALMFVTINLLVDVSYVLLDPRVHYE